MDDKRSVSQKPNEESRERRQKARSRVSSLCLVGFDVDADLVERGSEIGPWSDRFLNAWNTMLSMNIYFWRYMAKQP